jgi:hypothetical protein
MFLDLIQVPPPVHTVGADKAPVGVGSAPEDVQSVGVLARQPTKGSTRGR